MYHVYKGDIPEDFPKGKILAVDTETMGLNPHRDRLCVVQLSWGDGDAHLVQLEKGSPAPRLKALLEDSAFLKILHFARFDLAALWNGIGARVFPVYCTKIASKLARTYTDRHSLKDLVREFLGIDLSKQAQSSDWGGEELSQAQVEYAACDVLYLHTIHKRLEEMLEREGRRTLAQGSFAYLPIRAELDLSGFFDVDIFSH